MKGFIVLFHVLGDSQEQSNLIYCSSKEIASCSYKHLDEQYNILALLHLHSHTSIYKLTYKYI